MLDYPLVDEFQEMRCAAEFAPRSQQLRDYQTQECSQVPRVITTISKPVVVCLLFVPWLLVTPIPPRHLFFS